MVRLNSARVRAAQTPPTRSSKPEPPPKAPQGQAVLVKKGKETILCYLPEPLNPKSRSILVQRLEKSGGETKFESKEELKINPKDIIRHLEVSKKGQSFTVSKQIQESIAKPSVPKAKAPVQTTSTRPSRSCKSNRGKQPSPAKSASPASPASSASSSSESEPEESSAEVQGVPRKRANKALNNKTKGKSPSEPKKKLKLEVYKKGVTNPKVTLLKINKTLEYPSCEPDFSISIVASNRNVHRAVATNNQALFRNLIKSNMKISTLFGYWGPDYQVTPLELALSRNNEFFIREIFKQIKENKIKRAILPQNGLSSVGTGFVSKQAYGVYVRPVNMSRGGREGNNAFLM